MTDEAKRVIAALGLEPLPHEGGFFRVTWRSPITAPDGAVGAGSAIYYLLTPDGFSAFHRLRADELWHFHAGDAVEHVQLLPGGAAPLVTRLGADVLAGEAPQLAVPAGRWQGARLAPALTSALGEGVPRGWALLSCTLTPAWRDEDFTLGHRGELLRDFPFASDWIHALTR